MKRSYISISGRAVRFYESGDGPAVLLLHGAGGSARLWRRVMGLLSSGFRTVAPDLPGFGGSEFDPGATSRDGMSRFIGEFIDALRVGKASIVASSMGGRAACIFAADRPERVASLVLVSPAGLHRPDEPAISLDGLLREVENGYAEHLHKGRWVAEELEKALSTIKALHENGGLSTDIEGELKRITAPTLIIWGGDDRVVPVSYSEMFARSIGGSAIEIIGGAGHMPYVDSPVETAGIIRKFLEGRRNPRNTPT